MHLNINNTIINEKQQTMTSRTTIKQHVDKQTVKHQPNSNKQ